MAAPRLRICAPTRLQVPRTLYAWATRRRRTHPKPKPKPQPQPKPKPKPKPHPKPHPKPKPEPNPEQVKASWKKAELLKVMGRLDVPNNFAELSVAVPGAPSSR